MTAFLVVLAMPNDGAAQVPSLVEAWRSAERHDADERAEAALERIRRLVARQTRAAWLGLGAAEGRSDRHRVAQALGPPR